MTHIIPAILEKDFSEVKRKILAAEDFLSPGGWVQIDIDDGDFVPNTTWRKADDLMTFPIKANLSIHLMVANPREAINDWLIDPVKSIVVHYEALGESEEEKKRNFLFLKEKIKVAGKELGLAIKPETPIEDIEYDFYDADVVLFLAVNPGFQGSEFVADTPARIRFLRERNKNVKIGVDGGISDKTLPLFNDSGADYFVSGSYIWKSKNPKEAYLKLVNSGRETQS